MKAFSLQRFGKYLRFELFSRFSEQMLPLLVPSALYFLWAIGRLLNGGPVDSWGDSSFKIGLLLGIGSAVNSHRKEIEAGSAPFHMLLPATHGERFVTRWLLTFGLTFFGQLLVLTVLANTMLAISLILGRGTKTLLLPELSHMINSLGLYLTLHSAFFAGGIFFRKSPLIKTILALLGYGAALSLGALILTIAGVGNQVSYDLGQLLNSEGLSASFDVTKAAMQVSWQVLFPLLLYIAAFYRACENEARG